MVLWFSGFVREELGNDSLFFAMVTMWSDANAASGFDEIVQVSLADPDGASEPMSYDRAAMNQSADGIVMKP